MPRAVGKLYCDSAAVVSDPAWWQEPAFWVWMILLTTALVFDILMLVKHRKTLSHFLQHLGKGHTWFRWFVLIVSGLAGWHFGWGF
jgi:hypothetical protein